MKRLESKYSGVCVVCGQPYSKGDPIIWFSPSKTVTHEYCWNKQRVLSGETYRAHKASDLGKHH